MIKEELKKLWKDLFHDDSSYINWYFDNIYLENSTKLYLENENLKGMLFQNKYHISIDEDRFMGRYLVGVGVTPEKRGEGIMKNLLLESLREAYNYGEEFIYLTPIDKNIYERFGFGYISSLSKYNIPLQILGSFKKEFKVQKIDSENYNDNVLLKLKEFYREHSKEFYISVARDKKCYKNILSELFCEDGLVYISYDYFGKINGYMFVINSEKIYVKEMLFKEKRVLETLLSIVYGYKDYYGKLEIVLPENVYLEDYLETESSIEKVLKNKVQARILRVEKVLMRLSHNLSDSEEVSIYVQDDLIKENTGVFKLKKSSLERGKEDFDISLKIKELTMLSYGFRDFESLKKIEGFFIKNNEKEDVFKKIFKKRFNYFNQDF
ncbi:MAG: GNAT family N-acetyltransferase [Cetobacterium sp.]|uniref:GNAT family N-acetyltransferase n=1 Tax=Cetobacterium sp. TaxID=2071632 RepID=UPI003F2F195E